MRSFLLRLPEDLHSRLKDEAREAGISMQELCVSKLSGQSGVATANLSPFVQYAQRFFGRDLVGVVLFGSFARRQATQHSDVDVMVVIEPHVEITRELYRQWDVTAHAVDDRAVDAHFAHLPRAQVGGGLWAEAAVDGIVIVDSGDRIARALAAIRADMADGVLRRHAVHGQSYWTTAA